MRKIGNWEYTCDCDGKHEFKKAIKNDDGTLTEKYAELPAFPAVYVIEDRAAKIFNRLLNDAMKKMVMDLGKKA